MSHASSSSSTSGRDDPAVPDDSGPPVRWREYARSHAPLLVALLVLLAVVGSLDTWAITRRSRYRAEITRLRASMTDLERQRADQIVEQERSKLRVALALMQRQAQIERALHLTITVDTGAMYLEREGALLREMRVQIGPERRVGTPPDTVRLAMPRGLRTVTRVLADSDSWEVPAWVYEDRGMPAPPVAARTVRGALGPVAILLDGGTVIYSMPTSGPLNDSGFVLPGAVRARTSDLRAILPNLTPGMRVYFY